MTQGPDYETDGKVQDLVNELGFARVLESLLVVAGSKHLLASMIPLHSDCVYWSEISTHLGRAIKVARGEDPTGVRIDP